MLSALCTYNDMTADNRIHVRIQTDIKNELKIAAKLRGLKPSTYIHSLIVEAIGEAKKHSPDAFLRGSTIEHGQAGHTKAASQKKQTQKRSGTSAK